MKRNRTRAVKCTRKAKARSTKINTTLYELIEAVQEEAGAKESSLVPYVVLHLLGKASASEQGLVFH